MDRETAHRLTEATTAFYAAHAESFSGTRVRPWDGWAKVLEFVQPAIDAGAANGQPFRVLDIGCGNLRFEKLLTDGFPDQRFELYAVDDCPELACDHAQTGNVRFQQLDVIGSLENGTLSDDLNAPWSDLTVAFGLMHHIPLGEWREQMLKTMIDQTKPGGIVAITLWQFAKNEKLARKAHETTRLGCEMLGVKLDEASGDYLLGWQGDTNHLRYCHSFSDDEVAALERIASSLGTTALASFSADGPDGTSNRYLVLHIEH